MNYLSHISDSMNQQLKNMICTCLSIPTQTMNDDPLYPISLFNTQLIEKKNDKYWSKFNLFTHLFVKLVKVDLSHTGIVPFAIAREYYSFITKTLHHNWLNDTLFEALTQIQSDATTRKGSARNGRKLSLKIRENGFYTKQRGIRAACTFVIKYHRDELSKLDAIFSPNSNAKYQALVSDTKLKYGTALENDEHVILCIQDLNNTWKTIKDLEDIRGKTDSELCATLETFGTVKQKLGAASFRVIQSIHQPSRPHPSSSSQPQTTQNLIENHDSDLESNSGSDQELEITNDVLRRSERIQPTSTIQMASPQSTIVASMDPQQQSFVTPGSSKRRSKTSRSATLTHVDATPVTGDQENDMSSNASSRHSRARRSSSLNA
mgnify:CR=1 FL=1